MLTGAVPNSDIINRILGTAVTDQDLNSLVALPSLKPTNLTSHTSIFELIRQAAGVSGSHPQIPGIYIWTYIPTGQMYVGSSMDLVSRLRGYFLQRHKLNGKLLPLLYSNPITDFTLQIVLVPQCSSYEPHIILEQYHLLNAAFNLNTIRVANNPSGSNAKELFMYNSDQSLLYFASSQQIDFIKLLNIHHTTFTKHLTNGTFYLGKYLFTQELLLTATLVEMTTLELSLMIEQDRIDFNINKPVNSLSRSVVLTDKDNNKLVFHSLGACIAHFKSLGHKANQRTLVKRIDSGIEYYGYKCNSL